MQTPYSFSHDLTPHSLRNNSRVKDQSLQTQDTTLRWAHPRNNTRPVLSTTKGTIDVMTIQRFKRMAH
ncbi:MAG: hypothetical protein KTR29_23030 [Rhodothermaceae bacterium]|nr:hypothetical protein [Rhodothermaceae bacterium]